MYLREYNQRHLRIRAFAFAVPIGFIVGLPCSRLRASWSSIRCLPRTSDTSMDFLRHPDLFKLGQDKIAEVSESDSCMQPGTPGSLTPPASTYFYSPTSSSSRLLRDDSQYTLLDTSAFRRPEPVTPGGRTPSHTPSCHDTPACNTPSHWSLSEKGRERVFSLAVRWLLSPLSHSLYAQC